MKVKMRKVLVSASVAAACSMMTVIPTFADNGAGYSADDVWAFRAVANVEGAVNVRAYASEDSAVVGYLTTAAAADILEKGETWSLVISGGVEGYVKNEYLAFGEDAKYLASVYGMPGVKTYWDGVNLFAEPDGSSQILATAGEGQEYEVISRDGSWVTVQMDDVTLAYIPAEDVLETTILDRAVPTGNDDSYSTYNDGTYSDGSYDDGYYSDSTYSDGSYDDGYYSDSTYSDGSYDDGYYSDSSYSDSSYDDGSYSDSSYDDGTYSDSSYDDGSYSDSSYDDGSSSTVDTSSTDTSTASSVSASDRDLLAGIIYCEAGNQSREGKVAVGAVVMNRVASSSYADSISGVIYESGQFSPAGSGWLDSVIASGAIPSDCYEAADAALAGENPVGSAMYFNTGSGSGIKIGDHQFY